MDFSFYENEQISKELILSRITEEQIFTYYIGPEVISRKLFRSKIRNDKNPTCSMYRNKSGTLIYKDFATGEHLSCFNYVMSLYRCNYYEALKIIATKKGKESRIIIIKIDTLWLAKTYYGIPILYIAPKQ